MKKWMCGVPALMLAFSGLAQAQPIEGAVSEADISARNGALAIMSAAWQGQGTSYPRGTDMVIELGIDWSCAPGLNAALTLCDIDYESGGTHYLAHDIYQIDPRSGDLLVSYHGITNPIVHRYAIERFTLENGGFSIRATVTDLVGGQMSDMVLEIEVVDDHLTRRASSRPAGSDDAFHLDTLAELDRVM